MMMKPEPTPRLSMSDLPRDRLEQLALRAMAEASEHCQQLAPNGFFFAVAMGFVIGAVIATAGFLIGAAIG